MFDKRTVEELPDGWVKITRCLGRLDDPRPEDDPLRIAAEAAQNIARAFQRLADRLFIAGTRRAQNGARGESE